VAFVTLSKEQFEDILPGDYEEIELPNCKEHVYQIGTKNEDVNVRIYSTVDKHTNETRKIGADAIRIIFWGTNSDRPIGKSKKVLRVEGKTTIQERITSRINEFLETAHEQKDTVIPKDYLIAILSHNSVAWNSFAGSLLGGVLQYGSLTDKQTAYVIGETNPRGKATFETQCKNSDPNFYQKYLDNLTKEGEDNGDNKTIPENPEQQQEPTKARKKTSKLRKKIQANKGRTEKHEGDDQIFITSDGSDVDLIPTKNYTEWQYPFEKFNPVQSLSLPFKDQDCNMVISSTTSSGKTIAVEPMIDSTLAKGRKVLYTAPLKALCEERLDDWTKRFPDKEIAILTGDYVLSEKMKTVLNTADIIILTSEMVDSRSRKMETENNVFLKMTGLIIVDEAHLLTSENRGHATEVGLMRFTSINPYAKIVFLSATMPNVTELGEWQTILNGKPSTVIQCNWRPVPLSLHFEEHPTIVSSNGRPNYWGTQNAKRGMAVKIAMSKPDESFIVFVHDKNTGRDLITRFKKVGETAVFHNADVDKNNRKVIETKFRQRKQRILISTSTTAIGINLPARNVIIVGVHRGIQEVDELDIIQEIGRCGRMGLDDEGHAYVIVPQGTTAEWEYKINNPRPVNSVLNDHEVLAFHSLAEITNKVIRDEHSFMHWFDRSLAAKQKIVPFTEKDAKGLLTDLVDMEMISYKGKIPFVTGLGKVSSWLYYSPYDVYTWYDNFNKIYNNNLTMDDELLAWAIADIPQNNPGYIVKDMQETASNWQWRLRNRGVTASDSILSVIAMHEKLTDRDEVGGVVSILKRNIVFDIDRTIQALSLIDGLHAKWNQEGLWQTLSSRIKYSIPEEMVGLVSIPGVGGVRAKQLWEQGVCSVEDVVKINVNKLYDPFQFYQKFSW